MNPGIDMAAFDAVVDDGVAALGFALAVAPVIVNPQAYQKNNPGGQEKKKNNIEPGIYHWQFERLQI